MQPNSGLFPGAAQSSVTVAGVKEPPKIQRPEDEVPRRSLKRAMDEYVPEEKQEPAGNYWPGKDENGQPRIYFDDPRGPSASPKGQMNFLTLMPRSRTRAQKAQMRKPLAAKRRVVLPIPTRLTVKLKR